MLIVHIELYVLYKGLIQVYLISLNIFSGKILYLTDVKVCLSLVDFVLTSVNSEFTGISMVATRVNSDISSRAQVVT